MIDLTRETPLRISELAAFLGVHRRTVESWLNRGLESVKLGRLMFTTLEALQRFAVQSPVPETTHYHNRQRLRQQQSREDEERFRRMDEAARRQGLID